MCNWLAMSQWSSRDVQTGIVRMPEGLTDHAGNRGVGVFEGANDPAARDTGNRPKVDVAVDATPNDSDPNGEVKVPTATCAQSTGWVSFTRLP